MPVMDAIRPGQRVLLASFSNLDGATDEGLTGVQGLLLTVSCSVCFIILIVLCTCKESKPKPGGDYSAPNKDNIQDEVVTIDLTERKASQGGISPVENGGSQSNSNRNSVNISSKHSRQPSSASGNNVRPTSLRELPEPPITAHHSRNTSLSGVQVVASSGIVLSGGEEDPANNTMPQKDCASDGDGYDHLGPKQPAPEPIDYDRFGPAVVTPDDLDTPVSEVSCGMDGHYSQPKERMYAVCKDVRPKSVPAFRAQDKKDIGANHYAPVTEEDPYNQIDSGGTVPNSVIQRIRQNRSDVDDPYATVQGETDGNYSAVLHANSGAGARAQSALPTLLPPSDYDDGEDEYAVVQKVEGRGRSRVPMDLNAEEEISPYSVRPPEPPRLYEGYQEEGEEEHLYEEGSDQTTNSKDHKYSKVTARESLASMSARNALNPYETVADIPENTYATVEGGSGDGVVQEVAMRNRVAALTEVENRLSQSSDTYAEIAISGGGLTSSVISNTSISSSANPNVLGTSSGSSGAPIPPSLDSLPQMSKSLTSSEGDRLSDRLSDRFLGSPDERVLPGQFDDLGFSDNDGEDGYSTLTRDRERVSFPSSLRNDLVSAHTNSFNRNSESLTNGQEHSEDCANDPNYESVDELRAKVSLLKAKTESGQGGTSTPSSSAPHVTIVDVSKSSLNAVNFSSAGAVKLLESDDLQAQQGDQNGTGRRRRPNHDYEEVDVSPPQSPQTPVMNSLPSESSDTAETAVRVRVLNQHTYEEVAQVQMKKGQQSRKSNTYDGGKKKSFVGGGGSSTMEEKDKDKDKSKDRKKSREEKKKSKAVEKKKSGGEGGSSQGNTWDGSKKSNSWEANRTRL